MLLLPVQLSPRLRSLPHVSAPELRRSRRRLSPTARRAAARDLEPTEDEDEGRSKERKKQRSRNVYVCAHCRCYACLRVDTQLCLQMFLCMSASEEADEKRKRHGWMSIQVSF